MMQTAEPISTESKCAALEEAFRGLPINRAMPGAGKYEILIPAFAHQLVMMARGSRPRLSAKEEKRLRNLPPVVATGSLSQTDWEMLSRRPRPPATKEGLRSLEHSIDRTIEALDNLSPPALDALKETMPDPFFYRLRLNLIILRATAKTLRFTIDIKDGAPEKIQKSKIARTVGFLYYNLTGRKPTESNKPFVSLLGTVYDVLGFQPTTGTIQGRDRVSAYAQAKTLADECESLVAKQGD
jgi:hypothetical protein